MFAMINTTNQNIIRYLNNWYKGRRRKYIREKEWILRRFGIGTYMFELNSATLALLFDLKVKYNGDVLISILKPLSDVEIPEIIRKEVKNCINKKTYLTQEMLEELNSKMDIRYSLRLKEKLLE